MNSCLVAAAVLTAMVVAACSSPPETLRSIPSPPSQKKQIVFDPPTPEERRLHTLLNEYRIAHKLHSIPLSRSLSYVAKKHALDLSAHPPAGQCNAHSWSSHGPWTPCCYTPNHAEAQCLWGKPRELTNYMGSGYENGHINFAGATTESALSGWKASSEHNAVMLNQGRFAGTNWASVGIGITGNYAMLWFGEEKDPDGYW